MKMFRRFNNLRIFFIKCNILQKKGKKYNKKTKNKIDFKNYLVYTEIV